MLGAASLTDTPVGAGMGVPSREDKVEEGVAARSEAELGALCTELLVVVPLG